MITPIAIETTTTISTTATKKKTDRKLIEFAFAS